MPRTSRADAGDPSSPAKKVTGRSGSPAANPAELAARRRAILRVCAAAIAEPARLEWAARIVRALCTEFSIPLPKWAGLTFVEAHLFHSLAGWDCGVGYTLTFNISDEQRVEWIREHGNLTEGFRKEVLRHLRRLLGGRGEIHYTLVIEPKVATGKDASTYVDGKDGRPRRFDVHASFAVPADQVSEFQQIVAARTYRNETFDKGDPYPLYKVGRFARMKLIHYAEGWAAYIAKGLALTAEIHQDVTGSKPFASSQSLRRLARERYEALCGAVNQTELSARDCARIEAEVATINVEVPAEKIVERVRRVEEAVRLILVDHYPVAGPPIALRDTQAAYPGPPAGILPDDTEKPSVSPSPASTAVAGDGGTVG